MRYLLLLAAAVVAFHAGAHAASLLNLGDGHLLNVGGNHLLNAINPLSTCVWDSGLWDQCKWGS